MAKRFTDTEKYKKPFIRGLKGAYKLLWDYLYTSCDNAGIWIVDFEVAQIYLGKDMPVNREDALRYFNDGQLRIHEFAGGSKWFLTGYIEFQHGSLSETNPAHKKIIPILKSLDFIDSSLSLQSTFKAPYEGAKVEVVVIEKVEGKEKKGEKPKTEKELSAIRVMEYYNQATGRRLGVDNKSYLSNIIARFQEGRTEHDLCDLIDYKQTEWVGTDYEKHIHPDTLFAAKHSQKYYDQVQAAKDKKMTVSQIKGNSGGKIKPTMEGILDIIYNKQQ